MEDGSIGPIHRPEDDPSVGGEQSVEGPGPPVVAIGPGDLDRRESPEGIGRLRATEVEAAASGSGEVRGRKVEPATVEILRDVAEDVGQLKRQSAGLPRGDRLRRTESPDVDRREADGASDAAAVEFERSDIGDVERVEIHSHAVEHGPEVVGGDAVSAHGVDQRPDHRVGRAGALQGPFEVGGKGVEGHFRGPGIDPFPLPSVDDVVRPTAEGIERRGAAALLRGEETDRQGEARTAPPQKRCTGLVIGGKPAAHRPPRNRSAIVPQATETAARAARRDFWKRPSDGRARRVSKPIA